MDLFVRASNTPAIKMYEKVVTFPEITLVVVVSGWICILGINPVNCFIFSSLIT